MAKFTWYFHKLIFCVSLYCLLNLSQYSLTNLQSNEAISQKRAVNYKTAYRHRNIASFNYEARLFDDNSSNENSRQITGNKHMDKVNPNSDPLLETHNESLDSLNSDYIDVNDIYISVKTSKKFHANRVGVVLNTWFQRVKNQTFFFTDANDPSLSSKTDGHLINTGCNSSHKRRDLSCKMAAEYDGFIDSGKKWWCHLDDDNYLNVDQLVALLNRYKWTDDVYLGKRSLNDPFLITYKGKKEEFWFATGGAGLCVSRTLGRKMAPWSRHGELARTSSLLRVPDDCTVGFIATNRLGVNLTTSSLMHSHLEGLYDIEFSSIDKQVTLSYKLYDDSSKNNVITVPESVLLRSNDPTRLLSIHCFLNPAAANCR